ncbi:hypothetical protein ACH5RR_023429 [Cinchona calisaya]|uniref:Uncharacterized protein n=1 Tax=Cinchona calisaya TaxID=153742 RepID=A0ABD2ZEK7_9GENT
MNQEEQQMDSDDFQDKSEVQFQDLEVYMSIIMRLEGMRNLVEKRDVSLVDIGRNSGNSDYLVKGGGLKARSTGCSSGSGLKDFADTRVGLKKTDKSRRIWTLRDEEVSITALKELCTLGWKCDNVADALGKFTEKIEARLGTTAESIGYEQDMSAFRKKDYSSLEPMN